MEKFLVYLHVQGVVFIKVKTSTKITYVYNKESQ